MSYLKALQRQHTGITDGSEKPSEMIVPFDQNGKRLNPPPALFGNNLKIGNPGSAFIGQPDPTFGTALPDLGSDLTAGAKLNADKPARVGRHLPDFVSWTVDSTRVELVLSPSRIRIQITARNIAVSERTFSTRADVRNSRPSWSPASIRARVNP